MTASVMEGEHNVGYVPDHITKEEMEEVKKGTSNSVAKAVVQDQKTTPEALLKPNWKTDISSILILNGLYVLQGVPLGVMASIPLILAAKTKGNYAQQATFSLAGYPFSMKLLWAPLVDSLFWRRMGRRKSWLVPVQYLIGLTFFIMSFTVEDMLERRDITALTAAFFCLTFLAATQDIATDGWALTMLKPENVGHAATCNSIGQTVGVFLGFTVFTALESADFCNKFLRSSALQDPDHGIVLLSEFLFVWSIVYVVATTLVWIFKGEEDTSCVEFEESKSEKQVEHPGLVETYKMLLKLLRLKTVQIYALFLLTCQIGFAPAGHITQLKLIEAGVSKSTIALLSAPIMPMKIFLPVIISRYTAGARPMSVYLRGMQFKLWFDLAFAAVVWATPIYFIEKDGSVGWTFLGGLIVLYALHAVASYCTFVAGMAFHARVSDPAIGGTYMTLLNTLANLGGIWPATLVLALVDPLTTKDCVHVAVDNCTLSTSLEIANSTEPSTCEKEECTTIVDGYYILSGVCFLIGLVYILVWMKPIKRLQKKSVLKWRSS